MTWRGQPWPYSRDFWITETGVSVRLGRPGNSGRKGKLHKWDAILELGHMFNLKNRSAVGASISFQGFNRNRFTFHPRYRYWLDRRWAVDAAGGLVLEAGDSEGPSFSLPGYMARAGINYGDWVSVNTGLEFMPTQSAGTNVDWLVDSRLAGYLGGSTSAVVVSGVIVFFVLFISAGGAGD
jgi:hypothetical protein